MHSKFKSFTFTTHLPYWSTFRVSIYWHIALPGTPCALWPSFAEPCLVEPVLSYLDDTFICSTSSASNGLKLPVSYIPRPSMALSANMKPNIKFVKNPPDPSSPQHSPSPPSINPSAVVHKHTLGGTVDLALSRRPKNRFFIRRSWRSSRLMLVF